MRPQPALSLGIGHSHAEGKIAILNIVQVIQEPRVILTTRSFISHTPGGLVYRIEGIVGQVALGATTLTTQQTYSFEFAQQIFRVPVNVQHAIDRLT